MKLILLRHAQSEKNTKGIVNADPSIPYPLTPKGRKQARRSAERLRDEGAQAIYCSQLPRAKETAQIVGEALGIPVRVDARLNEMGNGVFEERPRIAYHLAIWNRVVKTPPGGERSEDVLDRMLGAFEDIRRQHDAAIIVSHGGPIHYLVRHLKGKPLADRSLDYPAKAASIILEIDSRGHAHGCARRNTQASANPKGRGTGQ